MTVSTGAALEGVPNEDEAAAGAWFGELGAGTGAPDEELAALLWDELLIDNFVCNSDQSGTDNWCRFWIGDFLFLRLNAKWDAWYMSGLSVSEGVNKYRISLCIFWNKKDTIMNYEELQILFILPLSILKYQEK